VSALSGYYKDLVFCIMVNSCAWQSSHAQLVEAVNDVALGLCAVADLGPAAARGGARM
jgi:hypothetical protein